MTDETNIQPSHSPSSQSERQPATCGAVVSRIGIREKLISIFLLVKILPLILLAYIAWQSLVSLGTVLRKTSVIDSQEALTAMAVENIERISTDAAQKVAEFLYQRDGDISFLAKHCGYLLTDGEVSNEQIENFFADFGESQHRHVRLHGHWTVAEDGMSWVQTHPYIPPTETKKRSVNTENEDTVKGATFHYRPPHGFGDSPDRYVKVPLYDEIALLDKNGKQLVKYVTPHSTKKRFPFPKELLDVSDPKNTFVRAEHYVKELPKLGKDGIYVSDVIGAYVPSRFIGMYTPNYLASRRIDAKIAALEAAAEGKITEMTWKLRVLNAELKHEEEKFNSHLDHTNKKIRDEINRRLGKEQTWKIVEKSIEQVARELETQGFPKLAKEIQNIPFHPQEEAYAGAENPLGIRFEGIIRWATPILDDHGNVQGYVTFALNHDHLMEMIDHITPIPERFTELSDAFNGNYAFVWDYQCRSIVHPRHHSICGYNPETGKPETPWLESTLYIDMIKKGFKRDDWLDYIATLTDYAPFAPNPEVVRYVRPDGSEYSAGYTKKDIDPDHPDAVQVRVPVKVPAKELTAAGLVGLDGRYLNNAPQCTGWMDLAKDGGSGSLYILWSGLYKLNTAAAIPYYTGKYSPDVRGNRCGFGFIAIGAGIDDFSRPAEKMGDRLSKMVDENVRHTTAYLIVTTIILSIIVIFIAIWMASYLSYRLKVLIDGITRFHRGDRNFRFTTHILDEFGHLANSFNGMAESIVRSVHTPLVITDLDLNIIYANEQCLDVMGANTPDDVVGQSYRVKSIYGYSSEHCPITALRCGKEARVLYLKKTDKFLQGIANYFTDERGVHRGYLITSNDVTELSLKQAELQQAKEEAEQASRHKSHFLWRMSHELRTPMNAMIGFNDILQSRIGTIQQGNDHQDLNNYLSLLKRSSLDLLGLLNDILEASNLESNTVELVNKPLDLLAMLEEISEGTRQSCDAKQLTFVAHIDQLALMHFLTDGPRLRQVISNLLNNAVKYTKLGQIDFIVRKKDHKDGKALLSFTVRDTGIGIPHDIIERIFHPFEQAETEETGGISGSGLGLAIVQKVLALFDSRIVVHSEPGKGSEFSFDVWLRECKEADKVEIKDIQRRFTGRKALVVDDVRLNRLVLVNLLQEAGFTADEAKNGEEGVKMFEQSPENAYSIIFMDIQMPVMDGYKAATTIRALSRQDAKTIPIVTISANAFKEDIDKSLANGMNAHFAKPLQKDVLAEILMCYCHPTD